MPIIDRTSQSPARSFTVTVSTPTNATIAQGTGVVTIGASGAKEVTNPNISVSPNDPGWPGRRLRRPAGHPQRPRRQPGHGQLHHRQRNHQLQRRLLRCRLRLRRPIRHAHLRTGRHHPAVRVPINNCGQTAKGTFYLELRDNSSDSTIARATTTITVEPKITDPGAPGKVTAVAGPPPRRWTSSPRRRTVGAPSIATR